MGRTTSAEERATVALPDFKIYGRLLVEGIPLEDYVGKNPLLSAKVTQDIDQVVQAGTFVVEMMSGSNSLSPYLSTGKKSFSDGGPLLLEDRAVALQIQCQAPGVGIDPSAWRKVFEGSVDTVDASPTAGTVTIACRDSMVKLLLTEIENIYTNTQGQPAWGFDVPAGLIQDGIQFILDTTWQYSYGSPFPDPFEVVGSQSVTASAFHRERTNLLLACRDLGVGKNGWDLRGKWDLPTHGLDSFVLTYYEPDRPGTASTFVTLFFPTNNGESPKYEKINNLSRSRIGVRNVAEVTPADTARVPVVAENIASIALYGRRFEAAAEDEASHVDTPAEATTLGEIIVTDLGKPKAAVDLVATFCWWLEINDLFVVIPDGRTFDSDGIGEADLAASAVFSVTHTELNYALGKGSLALQGRAGGGVAQAMHWRKKDEFQKENQRATYISTTDAVGPARERAIWIKKAAV